MQQVTVGFSAETISALDRYAAAEHGGDREAAVEALLDDWIEAR